MMKASGRKAVDVGSNLLTNHGRGLKSAEYGVQKRAVRSKAKSFLEILQDACDV